MKINFIYKLFLKLIIFFGSLVYAGFNFMLSLIIAGSTGLFGAPNTLAEQIVGTTKMICSVSIIVTALFIFKKNFFIPTMILICLTIADLTAFAFIEGLGSGANVYSMFYIIGLVVLYKIYNLLEKKSNVDQSVPQILKK